MIRDWTSYGAVQYRTVRHLLRMERAHCCMNIGLQLVQYNSAVTTVQYYSSVQGEVQQWCRTLLQPTSSMASVVGPSVKRKHAKSMLMPSRSRAASQLRLGMDSERLIAAAGGQDREQSMPRFTPRFEARSACLAGELAQTSNPPHLHSPRLTAANNAL